MLKLHSGTAAARRLRLIGVFLLCALAVIGGTVVVYDYLPKLFPNFHGVLR